jgi:hypothetical protein
VKDLTKQLVLKRDGGCVICNSRDAFRRENGHDGQDGVITSSSPTSSPEPNGLHLHHEYKTYKDEYWPRRDVPEKCVMLCATHHAKRGQDNLVITRDIRRYLKEKYPDYNFGKRFNPNTGAYDIPIGEFP